MCIICSEAIFRNPPSATHAESPHPSGETALTCSALESALNCMWRMSKCFRRPRREVRELNLRRLRNINRMRREAGGEECKGVDVSKEEQRWVSFHAQKNVLLSCIHQFFLRVLGSEEDEEEVEEEEDELKSRAEVVVRQGTVQ